MTLSNSFVFLYTSMYGVWHPGQVAEEHNLEWEGAAPVVPTTSAEKVAEKQEVSEEDVLLERLRKLQGL
jgi:hypothetical protein